MGIVETRLALLRRIARLRRAQARVPRDSDIAAVRAELEAELGQTVSQRIAARFLGVSHTALGRWIQSGDVPVVFSLDGRMEVPVTALLEIFEAVEGTPTSAHPLEGVLNERRDRARTATASPKRTAISNGHEDAERRGLAYHRAVADQLTRRQADEALYRVRKWRHEAQVDPSYAEAWETILRGSLAQVRLALTDESQSATDLRQNSPFAGTLSEPERRAVLEAADE